jgi:hypothetical protein
VPIGSTGDQLLLFQQSEGRRLRFYPLQVAAPVRGHIFSSFSSKNIFIFHTIKLSRIYRLVSIICTILSHE